MHGIPGFPQVRTISPQSLLHNAFGKAAPAPAAALLKNETNKSIPLLCPPYRPVMMLGNGRPGSRQGGKEKRYLRESSAKLWESFRDALFPPYHQEA